jgi:hypothetical protein
MQRGFLQNFTFPVVDYERIENFSHFYKKMVFWLKNQTSFLDCVFLHCHSPMETFLEFQIIL